MNIIKPLFRVSGMTLISRLLGFIRDILIAATFGAGTIADSFFIALKFPNIFRRIMAEGALSMSFIPMFSKKLPNKNDAKVFFREIFNFLFWSLLIVVSIFEILMPFFVYIIAPGFSQDPKKIDLVADLARISFPYLFFISLITLLCGVLNSLGKYLLAASMPIFVNISMIIALLYVQTMEMHNTANASLLLMLSFLISGLFQLILCIYGCKKYGFFPKINFPRVSDNVRKFMILSFPAIGAGGIIQINILIGSIIASYEDKAVSYLYYADRIYQLPLAMIGISIGIVLLPELSREISAKNQKNINLIQEKSLEISLLLAIPAAFGLIFLSQEIIMVLFERAFFTFTDTLATSRALIIFALGLPAFVCVKIFQIMFFSRENTRSPMIFAAISVFANIIISIVLFQYLGYLGIAISTTISSWINLYLLYRESLNKRYFIYSAKLLYRFIKIILASIIMVLILYMLQTNLVILKFSDRSIVNFLILLCYVFIGIVFYGLMCHILKIIELKSFFKYIR
ncbi:murein biosynthesis integral membrane protein MurJ [Gammaproteobacteria bacterium]|nr:murein biosynthesis integral membrane protein MurJ [Gammaproteobacteria bacterium]